MQSLLSGRHRSKLRGRGLDFDEVRKYVAGDDIRNIDWRVTARVGATHTKVFTEERERPVLLLVDQSTSMFFGSRLFFKSVTAAHTAALTAWRTLEVGDRVGGLVFDDRLIDYVSPKRDRRSVQRLLHLVSTRNQALSATRVENSRNILNEALGQAQQVATHDFLLVLISDFMWYNDQTMKNLINLSRHNDIIAAHVVDPIEEKLPEANLVLSDGEFQTVLEQHRSTRSAFLRNQEITLQKMYSQFRRFGIPCLKINTTEPVSTQLRQMMGGQIHMRRKTR
jgi:uncharacterized protein (DUF58 family)